MCASTFDLKHLASIQRSSWAKSLAGQEPDTGAVDLRQPRLLLTLLALYVIAQVALPIRPYLLDKEHPAWSCRGFNLSWQVMVAEKTGYVEFYARDPSTGARTKIRTQDYITRRQEMLMAQDPYLIRVMARRMSTDVNALGKGKSEIVVNAFATINGRPSQRIIDPRADLASGSISQWILPLCD